MRAVVHLVSTALDIEAGTSTVIYIESAAHDESEGQAISVDIKTNQKSQEEPRLLRRSVEGRMLGGVAAGLAKHFALDVTLVRIVVAVSFLSGAGVAIYVAAWLLIPEEGSEVAIADGFLYDVRSI
jgi:phage shock protein PspC (stress-responsive transcriptional regulator)